MPKRVSLEMKRYSLLERILFPRTAMDMSRLQHVLKGKTILITGASSGIGEQLALLLGRCDVRLILTARNEERLQAVKAAIEGSNYAPGEEAVQRRNEDPTETRRANVSIFSADLRDEDQLEALLDFIRMQPGQPDIVISNAGLSIRRSIFDSLDRAHDFSRTIAINYTAPLRLLLALIPRLQQAGGHIVNVSTVNMALIPFPYWAAYLSSKAAFDTWFRAAAPELNARGIATTSVYLPLVRTPMIAPTAAYANMPAMSAEHAARWIAKSLYTRKHRSQPWWLPFGQLASIAGRGVWERIALRVLRGRSRRS